MSDKPKLYYDSRADQPCEIEMYMHCGKCMEELPPDKSPAEWARLNVGVTATGAIQIWCARHDCNVNIFSGEPRPGLEYPEPNE